MRTSWRGGPDPDLPQRLAHLTETTVDLIVIGEKNAVSEVTDLVDRATFRSLCNDTHCIELLHWMRFSRKDPHTGTTASTPRNSRCDA